MNYKLEGAIKKNRKNFIICGILWVLLSIVFVVPVSYCLYKANLNGAFSLDIFLNTFMSNVSNPFGTLAKIFEEGVIGKFFTTLFGFTILYLIFFCIGMFKSEPKNEYSDIEHGSSDWSQRGEQYKILSKNKGIVLAEDNYLPIDKRGNTNVLVVGRFRFW